VKAQIDMSSGMPYFSVPTYISNTYIYLFPIKTYKYAVISKITLLNPEEKAMVKLETKLKEESKNNKFNLKIPRSILNQQIDNNNWFDTIQRLNKSETFDFLTSDVFMKLTNNNSNLSKNVYSEDTSHQIKDSFEIVPSDLDSAKALSLFYVQLKLCLKDLKAKLTDPASKFNKGIKSFYLLIVSKLRELNLPYHYVYTQILDVGIENKQTCHIGPMKLTEYACYLTEIFYNMLDIIYILLETDNTISDRFKVNLNCKSELINFRNSQKKGLVEDLINLSIFLKEKGEPFRVMLLKITKLYLTDSEYFHEAIDSKIFNKIGTFSIDTVASKRLNQEFGNNYSTLLAIDILTHMVEGHSYSIDDKLKNIHLTEGLSETCLERISSFNSLGWLTRFIHHRDSRIRFSAWNLLRSLVSSSLITQHPSLIDESLK
jgi:hypothetical protein